MGFSAFIWPTSPSSNIPERRLMFLSSGKLKVVCYSPRRSGPNKDGTQREREWPWPKLWNRQKDSSITLKASGERRHLKHKLNLKTQTKFPKFGHDPVNLTNYVLHFPFLNSCLFAKHILSCCLYSLPTRISFDHLQPGFHLEHCTKTSFFEVTTEDLISMYNGLFSFSASMTYLYYFALLTKPLSSTALHWISTLMTNYILFVWLLHPFTSSFF